MCEAFPFIDRAFGALIDQMTHVDRERRIQDDETARNRLFEVCPRLVLAERPLAELVLDATAPKRSRTSPFMRVKDLPHLKMEAPPVLDGVVLTARPEEKTAPAKLEHFAPAAVKAAVDAARPTQPARGGNTLVDDGAPLRTRHDSSPSNVVDDHRQAVRHHLGQTPPPPAQQQTATPTWRTRKKRNATMIVAFAAAALVLLIGGGTAVFFAAGRRGDTAPSNVAKAAEAAEPAPSPAVPPPPSPEPAAPPVPAVAPPKAARSDSKRAEPAKRRRQVLPDDEGAVGYIVVKREKQRVRVLVDGASIGDAPLKYAIDPGTHNVTLIRGEDEWGDRVTVPVKVAPGGRYQLNSGSK